MLLESRFLIMVMSWENRGVASSFLQGGSKYSKMLATTVGWWKKIWGCGAAETAYFGPFSMRFHLL